MIPKGLVILAALSYVQAAAIDARQVTTTTKTVTTSSSSSPVPQEFQTTPELFAGPTPTGAAPFLAETNPAPFSTVSANHTSTVSYIPNTPLETQEPISGNVNNSNIFQQMGNLSPYFPNPVGFGVNEYSLPAGSNITWLNLLHRHGSRYPTTGSGPATLGSAIHNATINATAPASFNGSLSFLNTWTYELGAEILVPVGKQELFDSGTYHYYQYGHLYNESTKLLARTTTEDRMLKSAEYFLAGFFGLAWTDNATIEVIIDETGFNNSLSGYNVCYGNEDAETSAGANASVVWEGIYLKNATARLNSMSKNFNWTTAYVYDAMQLCPYETVALGYSAFCDLFTWQEWEDFEYSIDIDFAGTYGFQSPTGRAVGVGYVEEVLARINHHLLTTATGSINVTLDNNNVTFPLNQSLNFDFSHDVNIASVLTAFGLTQFNGFLNDTAYNASREMIVSHMEPFGARLDIEMIQTPQPVNANRSATPVYLNGTEQTYIHFLLNQRTIPLHASFSQCVQRDDGWCLLADFLESQANALELANYNYACNATYTPPPYGAITNGAIFANMTF